MATLTKATIADRLHSELNINKREGKKFIDIFFEEVCTTLESGQSVKLSGFGNFILRDKNPRPGRNPKTGDPVSISARRVVTFRAGQKLKARVERYDKGESEK